MRRTRSMQQRCAPGTFSNITKANGHASIFCLPSRYEGFGLVPIEAMAFGPPIISTACKTGPRELLEDKRDAIMIVIDDHLALADALLGPMSNHAEADKLTPAAGKRDEPLFLGTDCPGVGCTALPT